MRESPQPLRARSWPALLRASECLSKVKRSTWPCGEACPTTSAMWPSPPPQPLTYMRSFVMILNVNPCRGCIACAPHASQPKTVHLHRDLACPEPRGERECFVSQDVEHDLPL